MATSVSPRLVELEMPSGQKIFVEVDPEVRLAVSQLRPPPGVATASGSSTQDVVKRFEEVAQFVADRATQIVGKFKQAAPSTVTLEFAIGVDGEAGIPFLAKGSSSANITITAEWKPGEGTTTH